MCERALSVCGKKIQIKYRLWCTFQSREARRATREQKEVANRTATVRWYSYSRWSWRSNQLHNLQLFFCSLHNLVFKRTVLVTYAWSWSVFIFLVAILSGQFGSIGTREMSSNLHGEADWAVVCLLAVLQVQLSVTAIYRWPHNVLWYHTISWCQSAVPSIVKRCQSQVWLIVSSAIASVQTFSFVANK